MGWEDNKNPIRRIVMHPTAISNGAKPVSSAYIRLKCNLHSNDRPVAIPAGGKSASQPDSPFQQPQAAIRTGKDLIACRKFE